MKRRDDATWQIIAGEYALGTLAGPARERFRKLRDDDAYYCTMADGWERQFLLLTDSLPPVAPSPQLWSRISYAVDNGPESKPNGGWRVWGWVLLAAGIAVLSAGLMI